VFVSVGTVDTESYGSEQALRTLQYETRATLDALVNHSHHEGRGARWYDGYASDRRVELERLAVARSGNSFRTVCSSRAAW
jgi:hypothetical protein